VGDDPDAWPLTHPLVRPDLVQLVWGDGQVEPADVELLKGLALVLLPWPRLVIRPDVGIRQEPWIHLPLFKPKFFALNRNYIVDRVPSVDDQMVRLWVVTTRWHVVVQNQLLRLLLLLLLFLLGVLGRRRHLSSLLF
jgi:hypothetical protein